MSKDPRRYTPRPYGHAAPWNREPSPPPRPAPTRRPVRWPWIVAVALAVAAIGWRVYDATHG